MSRRKITEAARAARLQRDFAGRSAELSSRRIRAPSSMRVALEVGELVAVIYDTGKGNPRIHKFGRSAKPKLVVSADGRQLAIIGGKYKFTARGIENT